jgi:hypothetical protein
MGMRVRHKNGSCADGRAQQAAVAACGSRAAADRPHPLVGCLLVVEAQAQVGHHGGVEVLRVQNSLSVRCCQAAYVHAFLEEPPRNVKTHPSHATWRRERRTLGAQEARR